MPGDFGTDVAVQDSAGGGCPGSARQHESDFAAEYFRQMIGRSCVDIALRSGDEKKTSRNRVFHFGKTIKYLFV